MDEVPRVLAGRYEVGELIGRGGMAEVHIGYDNRLSRTVAIKILRSDLARDPTFQARFRREAQSAAALNHPAIVAVYDTGEQSVRSDHGPVTVPFIVMEYVEGHTLRDLVKVGDPMPIDEAVDIIVGVLGALEYSHREGIVHRDIKPGNIMLTTTGAVKVMDFGIARAMADSAATMTQTNAVVGTAQYLSPEQARGEVVDARSDLYSTGCVLYELLTGQPLFSGDSAVSVAYQHVRETPRPPSAVTPDIPEDLDRVVMKALAKDRDARYADAADMRSDLLAAVRGGRVDAPPVGFWAGAATATAATTPIAAAGPATRTMTAPPPPANSTATQRALKQENPEPERRSRWWVWLLVLVGLLAAGGIAYLATTGEEETPTQETVVVPDLEGLDQAGIGQELRAVGLNVNIAGEATSEDVEEGLFLSSIPAPGDEVPVDSTVNVTLSAGPGAFDLEDLTGMSQDQARARLRELGLELGTVTVVDEPNAQEGDVVATDPAAGASVEPGTTVNLSIASGNVEMPELTGLTESEATQQLQALGLYWEFEDQETGDFPPGTILEQSRPAGGVVTIGETITLTRAIEAPPVETPSPTDTEAPSDGDDDTPGGGTDNANAGGNGNGNAGGNGNGVGG